MKLANGQSAVAPAFGHRHRLPVSGLSRAARA